jgi:hypothetical protein
VVDSKFLNEDEKMVLAELLTQPGLKPLFKILEAQVALLEREVLTFDLHPGHEADLVIRKARAEGARRVANKFTVEVERLRVSLEND